mmetsp:Transcript_19496/g.60576  ORF Transcript_19496/g.60576 Transcript_19496/m.60576 type:complete len:217 (+) Transcript_19496:1625-2275(+)
MAQKSSGSCASISHWRSTKKPSVGNWQGPYDSSGPLPSSRSWPWKSKRSPSSMVWKRVKAAPTRRSISCRASTALVLFSSGARALCTALRSSPGLRLEKCARETCCRSEGRALQHTSITSYAMFSPSRSQSSHSIRRSHERARNTRFSLTSLLASRTSLLTGSPKSDSSAHERHLRYAIGKSISIRWPVTLVKTMVTCAPRSCISNSNTLLYGDRP